MTISPGNKIAKLCEGIFLLAGIGFASCINSPATNNGNTETDFNFKKFCAVIGRDSILKIAEKDARSAYVDLSIYTIKAALRKGNWYVDYDLTDPTLNGGGPHYVISAKTGRMVECRHEQ